MFPRWEKSRGKTAAQVWLVLIVHACSVQYVCSLCLEKDGLLQEASSALLRYLTMH